MLCDGGDDQLELRVVRGTQTLRRESVRDVALALGTTAREMEELMLAEPTRRA